MPVSGYPALLAERTLARWMRGHNATPTVERERQFRERVLVVMGLEAACEFDNVVGNTDLDSTDPVLFFVGTLLVKNGQHDLWHTIYHVATDGAVGEELEFLDKKTAAMRRGEI